MNILITGGASGLGEAIVRLLANDSKNTIFFTYSNSQLSAKKIELDFKNALSISPFPRDGLFLVSGSYPA